jgi:hypothetical protein
VPDVVGHPEAGYHHGIVVRLALLLLILAAAPAMAAVAGVPEAPRPGPRPAVWFAWGNDAFGGETGDNTDDYRTNAFTLGVQHDGWVLGLDHGMLTDRRLGVERRSDQLSLALGREWTASASAYDRLWLAGGLGARATGDWGGQRLQDRWHQLNRFNRYSLAQDESAFEGTAWAHGEWLLTGEAAGVPDLPFLRPGQLGLDLRASGLLSSGGERIGSISASVALLGADAHALFGLTQELRGGTSPNATAERTAGHERGTWFTYGLGAGGWFVNGGWALSGAATWGAVGWQWGREPARTPTTVASLEGVFALYQGYALGMQYRWQPEWLGDLADRQLSCIADYRFGRLPGPDLAVDNQVVMRQGLLGLDWEPLRLGDAAFSLAPFVQAGAGVREERIKVTGALPGFPEQGAQRGVVQGSLGVRCLVASGLDHLPAYGFSLVYDLWQPLGGATASNPATGAHASYQHGGGAMGLRFSAQVAW